MLRHTTAILNTSFATVLLFLLLARHLTVSLHVVKGFLVYDGLMGVPENRSFVLVYIMAFLVLEVLSSLKFIVCPEYRQTSTAKIFESLGFVHALAAVNNNRLPADCRFRLLVLKDKVFINSMQREAEQTVMIYDATRNI